MLIKYMFSNSKIIMRIIVISTLTKIIVIMIFPIIEHPYTAVTFIVRVPVQKR